MKSIKEAIDRLNCDNVLECFFGLNEADISIFHTLRKLGPAKIEIISKETGKRENSVYKSLQKMMMAGIIIREKKTIDDGGYYYVYKTEDIDKMAKEMLDLLERWYNRMREVVKEFIELNRQLEAKTIT